MCEMYVHTSVSGERRVSYDERLKKNSFSTIKKIIKMRRLSSPRPSHPRRDPSLYRRVVRSVRVVAGKVEPDLVALLPGVHARQRRLHRPRVDRALDLLHVPTHAVRLQLRAARLRVHASELPQLLEDRRTRAVVGVARGGSREPRLRRGRFDFGTERVRRSSDARARGGQKRRRASFAAFRRGGGAFPLVRRRRRDVRRAERIGRRLGDADEQFALDVVERRRVGVPVPLG
mmetsp:Transcript_11744/g.49238  ORF Transcript_11744/g.49238 Transcript_11744/m.49238 type:complete len:232 (-) Transcript_11744:1735-2430(-)